MALDAGTRLGPYEIVAPLGAGGMGEVYRARDTRLDRTVAIKVLNSQLTASAELRGRFEREAKVISHLNHPHICTLHDVGSENGTDFLVMEFLEGQTLSERLRQGPLPSEELLKVAVQIADALEKAHRAGIVHRDLKPGNVMLTKSGAKLLDFGLAKPKAMAAAPGPGSSSNSVFSAAMTMTSPASPLSSAGNIIGTVQYMSPEQISGGEADARSDIFAFGLVLYEMATGKRAFEGKTQASIVGQILAVDPPPISSLQPITPPGFERVVTSCLEKDPEERIQSAHDVKLRLQEIAESPSVAAARSVAAAPAQRGRRAIWILAATILVLAVACAYFGYVATRPKPLFRASLIAPEKTIYVTTPPDSGVPVISPDGVRIAFIARDSRGIMSLYVRALDSLSSQQLSGTEGANHPFWSPDSRNIGYFADGKLKRIDANGGPAQELAQAGRGRGGAWSPDGTIIYAPGINDALLRISAGGGTPAPATKLAKGETSHRWPSFLPDGKHFIFWQRGAHPGIFQASLDSLEHTLLFENSTNAVYAPGYLLFVRDQTLMAQPFSARKRVTTGDAVPIADHIAVNGPSYRGVFSVSENGMLVYQSGAASSGWQLQQAGRDGKLLATVPDRATFLYPKLSPDGKRIVVGLTETGGSNIDIWVFDLVRSTKTRLTFDAAVDNYPIWAPDGKHIIFSSNRSSHFDLYTKAADGSGSEDVLLHDDSEKLWKSVSPDGRYIVYQRNDSGGATTDLWVLPLFGDRKPFPIVKTQGSVGQPSISPDGKWMAYHSDENKRVEVFITPFPGGGPKWQVSTNGGFSPKWRGDGKELFFVTADNSINAVDVAAAGNSVTLGVPHALFAATLQPIGFGPFDVTRDGKTFLLNSPGAQESDTPLTLVTNWLADLKK